MVAEVLLLAAFLFGIGITYLKPALKDFDPPVAVIIVGLVFAVLISTASAQDVITQSILAGHPVNPVTLALSGALQSLLGAVLYIAGVGFAEIAGGKRAA